MAFFCPFVYYRVEVFHNALVSLAVAHAAQVVCELAGLCTRARLVNVISEGTGNCLC